MTECSDVVTATLEYLQAQFLVSPFGENECHIVMPVLTSDIAPVELFVRFQDRIWRITDDGETLGQLFVNGLDVYDNKSLLDTVQTIAHLHGIHFENYALYVETDSEHIGEAVRNVCNAVQAVSYLIFKRSHRAPTRFSETVENYLAFHRVKYEPNHRLQGKTTSHRIPIYVNSGRNFLIYPLTARNINSARQKAKSVAFVWTDLYKRYADQYRYTVVLDDEKSQAASIWGDTEVEGILHEYSTHVFSWRDEKEQLIHLLQREESL